MKGFLDLARLLFASLLMWRCRIWAERAAGFYARAVHYRERGNAALQHAHELCQRSDALEDLVLPPGPNDGGKHV